MNRNRFRLVFKARLGQYVPLSEVAKGHGNQVNGAVTMSLTLAAILGVLSTNPAGAALPVPSNNVSLPFNSPTIPGQSVSYVVNGNTANVNQVGNKSILNWNSFNVSAGNKVQFNQVDGNGILVPGATFTSLNRIWDANPSVIAGAITQGAGQSANVILVNNNGIAFMGGSSVNLNSFTASSLNLADTYVVNGLLGNLYDPQFTSPNPTVGFIKVFEGANITAGSQGRVMLLAPTASNSGTIIAPDGQVIIAAGSKVYLRAAGTEDSNVRGLLVEVDNDIDLNGTHVSNHTTPVTAANGQLDGQSLVLAQAAYDFVGLATNHGTISAPRGNVTMVGYAVNQAGLASASTSVVANGSIYLLAKDNFQPTNANGALQPNSTRGGQLVLGSGSVTQVLPEIADSTTAQDGTSGAGLTAQSQVKLIGQTISMQTGAAVVAPAGVVNASAVSDPSTILSSSTSPFGGGVANYDPTVWIDVGSGALIDVSGLNNIGVAASATVIQGQLRGNELADSVLNRSGPIYKQTVYFDVVQALANYNNGLPTLISGSSLQSYAALIQRTVAERSTAGGSVSLQSIGQVVLDNGSNVNISGGSVNHLAGMVPTTLLYSGKSLTTVANARSDVLYTGLANEYTVNYSRWNRSQSFNLPQTETYSSGYIEGKAAGALNVYGYGHVYMQENLIAGTTVGSLQAAQGTLPAGASLNVNAIYTYLAGNAPPIFDNVVFDSHVQALPTGYYPGDLLTDYQTLQINATQIGSTAFKSVTINTNGTVNINVPLRLGQGGTLGVTGSNIDVHSDITAPSGNISLTAKNNSWQNIYAIANGTAVEPDSQLTIDNGVHISTAGTWVNKQPNMAGDGSVPMPNGGSIQLNAGYISDLGGINYFDSRGSVNIGSGAVLDTSAGAILSSTGTLAAGNAGSIGINAYGINGLNDSTLQAYAARKGGQLSLVDNQITIGPGISSGLGNLVLDAGFFSSGGFGSINLKGLTSLEVLANTNVAPRETNWIYKPEAKTVPTGTGLTLVTTIVPLLPDYLRQGVSLTMNSYDAAIGQGTVKVGIGATITVDPVASISMRALNSIDIEGNLIAHGGNINLLVDQMDPSGIVSQQPVAATSNTLVLGNNATLDVSGIAISLDSRNAQGITSGSVLAGGSITLTAGDNQSGLTGGFIVTQPGSMLSLYGLSPQYVATLNAQGGIGNMVGSDAGKVVLFAEEGLLLNGGYSARAGSSAGNRGGSISITLQGNDGLHSGLDTQQRWLELAQSTELANSTVVPGISFGLVQNQGVVTINGNGNLRATVAADTLAAAGFDQMTFSSSDAIALTNQLVLNSGRVMPLQSVTLDAGRIVTLGGNPSITAYSVQLGNFDASGRAQQDESNIFYTTNGLPTGATTGTLTVNATNLELAGNLRLRGMQTANLTGQQMVELSAVDTCIGNSCTQNTYTANIDIGANAVFNSAVIAPSTYSTVNLSANGHSLTFNSTGAANEPLMGMGRLTINAASIDQEGAIWAPLGSISYAATNSITLGAGSLTSVAANSVLPLGEVQNGVTWFENLTPGSVSNTQGQIILTNLQQKSITLTAPTLNTRAGSTINVAGGGGLQAWEFTVGPTGTKDVLAQPNTYAVMTTTNSQGVTVPYAGIAPADPQEPTGLAVGSAIYFHGVTGLPDGTYTLLPAHYALLQNAATGSQINAMAVVLNPGSTLQSNQGYTRADGLSVVSAYLSDTRTSGSPPVFASPLAVTLMNFNQIESRSGITTYQAGSFFSTNRPQDAGYVGISATANGAGSLNLGATFDTVTASGGQGAQIDISAPKLAIVAPGSAYSDSTFTSLDVGVLDALGAQSLLIGGTRNTNSGVTNLIVGANAVVLGNTGSTPLQAQELMLAAQNSVTLQPGSTLSSQGATSATNTNAYNITGDGAFIRVANSRASFTRTGSSGAQGLLAGDITSSITSASAITLDATLNNNYSGALNFSNNGSQVAGNLTLSSSRISLGVVPANTSGLVFSQSALDGFNSLNSLALTSYSTIDLYGNVQVGAINSSAGQPTLGSLTLVSAGLAGIANSGQTASISAQTVTLSNAIGASYVAGGSLGNGNLSLMTTTLKLGTGNSIVQGFDSITATATEIVAQGSGSLEMTIGASRSAGFTTQRLRAASASAYTISCSQALTFDAPAGSSNLPGLPAEGAMGNLGAQLSLTGSSVVVNTAVTLPSGSLAVTANAGNVLLGSQAAVDVSGRTQTFFDTTSSSSGGLVTLTSTTGNINVASGASINVSGIAGSNAGNVSLNAVSGSALSGITVGTITLAAGTLISNANIASGGDGAGGNLSIDANNLSNFDNLSAVVGTGGFTGSQSYRARNYDVTASLVQDSSSSRLATIKAYNITIEADQGSVAVNGLLDASGATGGNIRLIAGEMVSGGNVSGGVVNVGATASLNASANEVGANAGSINIASNLAQANGNQIGGINFAAGSTVNLTGGTNGTGGLLALRAMRSGISTGSTAAGNNINVGTLAAIISGESAVTLEGVKVYGGISTLSTATGSVPANTLTLAKVTSDDTSFGNSAAVTSLRNTYSALPFKVLAGVEVDSTGNLTLASAWDLHTARTGPNSDPGVLTLRAAGNMSIGANLSDGFLTSAITTGTGSATAAATVLSTPSWSFNLVAGADTHAADPIRTAATATGNFTLNAGNLIRTGTGNINVAASGDITLTNASSVIYTAGALNSNVPIGSLSPLRSQYTVGGGNVNLMAGGNIVESTASSQLYSEWLFRSGLSVIDANGNITYPNAQPAWWVRFDQFQQGVAALGGGNVNVSAGGNIVNLSASTVTEARLQIAENSSMVITGGGNLSVTAGQSIEGGKFLADGNPLQYPIGSTLTLNAGTNIASGGNDIYSLPMYTLLALGNARASVSALGTIYYAGAINPQLLPQSVTSIAFSSNIFSNNASKFYTTIFSTYTANSSVNISSLTGNVDFLQGNGSAALNSYDTALLSGSNPQYSAAQNAYGAAIEILPPTVNMTAYNGSILINNQSALTLMPSASGELRLLAQDNLMLGGQLLMSDADPTATLTYLNPSNLTFLNTSISSITQSLAGGHAATPIHANDATPVQMYAVDGSVNLSTATNSDTTGYKIYLPKAAAVRAGMDIINLDLQGQNVNSALNANGAAGDETVLQAGRDILFSSQNGRTDQDGVFLGGEGKLILDAGRNINLGTSGGVITVGNSFNANLPSDSASIYMAAGGGSAGIDYHGALVRLQEQLSQSTPSDSTLWLARWLLDDNTLTVNSALTGVDNLLVTSLYNQRFRVVSMVDLALLTTGRDHNNMSSPYAGDYSRGFDALELLFPGISEASGVSMAAGAAVSPYQGSINLFASRVKTTSGGDINMLDPGGSITVGLANTPSALVGSAAVGNNALGIVVAGPGNINAFTRDNLLVNQSRILTVDGGNLMLWSSYGDIDAGKGAKTASAVPPPIVSVDSQGRVSVELQGAASGSGIGALAQSGGAAGSVDLIAPNGSVNAGDAGIRAGNLNIAAQVVLNADNIAVSGTSTGTPVVDNSAVTASTSGASSSGGDISKTVNSLASAAADAANAAKAMADSFKPSYLRVEVVGYGDQTN